MTAIAKLPSPGDGGDDDVTMGFGIHNAFIPDASGIAA
jgi:hypothetical protein